MFFSNVLEGCFLVSVTSCIPEVLGGDTVGDIFGLQERLMNQLFLLGNVFMKVVAVDGPEGHRRGNGLWIRYGNADCGCSCGCPCLGVAVGDLADMVLFMRS